MQGKITQLSDYKLQFDTTKSAENKAIIVNVVRQQFAEFNSKDLDNQPALQAWLTTIRGN